MANNLVDKILNGENIRSVCSNSGLVEKAYDEKWEQDTHNAAKNVFAACNKLWDLMAFAPDKYFHDDCQDALNAYSRWYQNFLKVKDGEI
jgi:hypothetical protein